MLIRVPYRNLPNLSYDASPNNVVTTSAGERRISKEGNHGCPMESSVRVSGKLDESSWIAADWYNAGKAAIGSRKESGWCSGPGHCHRSMSAHNFTVAEPCSGWPAWSMIHSYRMISP